MVILRYGKEVFKVDLSRLGEYVSSPYDAYFQQDSGAPYKLLSYLSVQLPFGSRVADLGTNTGASAVAFSYNLGVEIHTFDISPFRVHKPLPFNVHFHQGDCLQLVDRFISSQIIYVDIDPHNGLQEQELIDILVKKDFRGLAIFDDILLDRMQSFWEGVKLKKIDISNYGHNTGTGVVVFNPEVMDILHDK